MAYYIVYKNKIKENISKLKNAFLKKGLDFQLFYSVKTNFMEPVLETVKQMGGEFEIVSILKYKIFVLFKISFMVSIDLPGPLK